MYMTHFWTLRKVLSALWGALRMRVVFVLRTHFLPKPALQVRTFALAQRASIKDFEHELEPGVFAGQKLIPIATAGCYVPGGLSARDSDEKGTLVLYGF